MFVALSAAMKIPLIGHINTELGYIAFGAALVMFGYYGIPVGVIGCVASSLIFSGFFPVGWIAAQIITGAITVMLIRILDRMNCKNPVKIFLACLASVFALAVGIVLVKTIIECLLFKIPLEVKATKNLIAFVADSVPMIIGIMIGFKFRHAKE